MRFQLMMDCGNAAFDDQPELEVARILRVVAGSLERNGADDVWLSCSDVNGNVVGRYRLSDVRTGWVGK